jgi:hypothetical protein
MVKCPHPNLLPLEKEPKQNNKKPNPYSGEICDE